MSTLGKTFSKDPRRDKKEDLIAANIGLESELLRMAAVVRSQIERIHALDPEPRPLNTRTQNSPVAVTDEAA